MTRGSLIVVEGLDRAGKSTQCQLLHDKLAARGSVELLKFPDRTTLTGKMIDGYLQSSLSLPDEAIHLLFSANRWEAAESIKSKLESGITLIVDRYVFSGIAFSAAKGLDLEWCKAPDVGLPGADLVIFLDVSPETAKTRGGFGEERYEKQQFQEKVRTLFKSLATPSWKWLSADGTVDEVAESIWEAVGSFVPSTEITTFK